MKKKVKEHIKSNLHIMDIEYWGSGDILLPAKQVYALTIDYPFNDAGHFPIKTGKGLGFVGLMKLIYKYYVKHYANVEKDGNGYWHGMEDLYLEGIDVDHKAKTIKLDVGS